MAHPWPLFDLRLRTPRLELRLPSDDDLLALVEVASAGIHDPTATPFQITWDELPSPAFERQFLLHWWVSRGSWKPENWTLSLAVIAGGRPIGIQDLIARDFSHRRSVSTGSWLGQTFQGRGYGTEMRAAVLWLAFEGLGAIMAESGYIEGNRESARVSEKLGYVPNGERLVAPRGEPLTRAPGSSDAGDVATGSCPGHRRGLATVPGTLWRRRAGTIGVVATLMAHITPDITWPSWPLRAG